MLRAYPDYPRKSWISGTSRGNPDRLLGFHADFGVASQRGGERFQGLVCYSCYELKLFGPGIDLIQDLGDGPGLAAVLKKYRKNRPNEPGGGWPRNETPPTEEQKQSP